MIELEARREGTILPVRARAGGRSNQIGGQQDGHLKVSVTQSPEKGKANKAIIGVLAKGLSLRKSQFELLSGATNPKKRFLVRQITVEELRERIDSLG